MIKVYLVRHCESEGNKSRIFQGQHDADISEKGKKQLEFLAERFRDIPLDTIYASRLMRAQKTAQAIANVKGMSVETNNAFIEINLGEFDGKPFDYIFETNPELKHAWYYEPYSFAPPGGETMQQVYDRAEAGFKEIIENPENDGKTILIVAHGCCLRALMCSVLHGDIMRLGEMKGSANTAVTLLVCNENGVKAEYMCDASHLPEEFATSTKNVYTESR